MRILQVHNFYKQPGGEDQVVAAERALLSRNGHSVTEYTLHNNAVDRLPARQLAVKTVWNYDTYRAIQRVISDERIELLHVHNTLALVSPAVYYAASAQQTPVVQTLHNYRLLCPAATLYRQGQVCELCVTKKIKYPAVIHRCYRDNFAASAAVSTMLALHGFAGTYRQEIHTYIALTEFARGKFCEGGLPPERITVKPNFLADDPGAGPGQGGYALFAGRLSAEKGAATLLDAWSACPQSLPLKIAGDGPLQPYVKERAASLPNVEYLGACEHSRIIELLKEATFLVFPSRWYEGMPMVVLEAMACGTPTVSFGLGSLKDLILDGVHGVHLASEDSGALSQFLRNSGELPHKMLALRNTTRAHFERNFTAEINYGLLMNIYNRLINQARSIS